MAVRPKVKLGPHLKYLYFIRCWSTTPMRFLFLSYFATPKQWTLPFDRSFVFLFKIAPCRRWSQLLSLSLSSLFCLVFVICLCLLFVFISVTCLSLIKKSPLRGPPALRGQNSKVKTQTKTSSNSSFVTLRCSHVYLNYFLNLSQLFQMSL